MPADPPAVCIAGQTVKKSLGGPGPANEQTRFKEDAATGPAGPPGAALRSWRRRLAPCKQCEAAHDPWVRRDQGQGSPAALAAPTAWRATAAPEAQPRAIKLVQIVVRARPAAHDTICHRCAALHAWQFGRCWDMPPAPPAACGSLCAGRAMLSPLDGLRTSAARTTSCWTGCAVAFAALRQRCALGNWAGAMQRQGSITSDPAQRGWHASTLVTRGGKRGSLGL